MPGDERKPVFMGVDFARDDDVDVRCWLRRLPDGRIRIERLFRVFTNRAKEVPDDR